MKKLIEAIRNTLIPGVYATVNRAVTDDTGSDTTEKIGMVVVAVVIVGLLAVAVRAFMPGLFTSIGTIAQQKLEGIF